MTKREFYNVIISMNSVPAEIKEKAADLIAALDISTAKASSLLSQLANESKVVGEEISVPKQGKRKQWRLAPTDEVTE